MVHDQVRDRERIWSFHLQASIDLIGSYVTSDFTSVPAAVAVVPYHRPLGALASIHFGVLPAYRVTASASCASAQCAECARHSAPPRFRPVLGEHLVSLRPQRN